MKIFEIIERKPKLGIPVWLLFLIPFTAYLFWEGYWYTKVGLRIVKWHTHFAEYVYVWCVGAFIVRAIFGKSLSDKGKNWFLAFSAVLLLLFFIENILQVTGLTRTYMEKVTGDYFSPYSVENKAYYHTWPKGKEHWIRKPEYAYWRPTNSMGLPDIEWPIAKKLNEKRIMALGDSFTEGDGAPYDSSYVSLLKQKLLSMDDSVYLMNAGVMGSDPFFNYKLLKDQLLKFNPDLIVLTIGSQDILTDILQRGGMERFKPDSTVKYTNGPWWEPIYAVSYISRLFFKIAGFNELLRKEDLTPMQKAKADKQMIELFKNYTSLCQTNGIRFFVVLRPDCGEVIWNKYRYDFSIIFQSFKSFNNIEVIDLLPSYKEFIEKNNSDISKYYWPKDGHHNSKGYEMMAETIFEKIAPLLKDSAVANHQQGK